MRRWVYLPGGIIPAAYNTYKKMYERYPGINDFRTRHPRLAAMKEAIITESIRDGVSVSFAGYYLLAHPTDLFNKIFLGAFCTFLGVGAYLFSSLGADSGLEETLTKIVQDQGVENAVKTDQQ